MPNPPKPEVKDILRKYEAKIESIYYDSDTSGIEQPSKEYVKFKEEAFQEITTYENFCKFFGKILTIKPSRKDEAKYQDAIETAHLQITPAEAISFAVNIMILGLFLSIGSFVAYFVLTERVTFLLPMLGIIISLFAFHYFYTLPIILAKKWRLKASSQLVPALLYIVVYMKHTSNLELAIKFASENLQPPLSLDLRKIFWDVEVGKYATIRDSLDAYLETWKKHNLEFVEAIHLIESSLYETNEHRRIEILERSLQVMLDGVHEKMLSYVHNIKAPLTNIYMLGIVLPTLALALLPLSSALLGGLVRWQHIFVLFNIIIPFLVYYLSYQILLSRPGGYGEAEVLELNPDYAQFKSKKPFFIAAIIAFPFFIIGLLPLLLLIPGVQEAIAFQDFSVPF
ncbi:MAG: hypothetical protein AABX59_00820, partial [Nanoarchaeota archaeon]